MEPGNGGGGLGRGGEATEDGIEVVGGGCVDLEEQRVGLLRETRESVELDEFGADGAERRLESAGGGEVGLELFHVRDGATFLYQSVEVHCSNH